MPNHAKCLIEGSSQGGEVWSVGLAYTGATASFNQTTLQAWATGVAAHIAGLASTTFPIALLSSSGAVTNVRCELRSNTDTLILAAEAPVSPAKVGQGVPSKSFQSSVVFSLRTPIPGRSFRGRVYWPGWAYGVSALMRFGSADVTAWLTGFKALNVAIIAAGETAEPATDLSLCVRSKLLDVETVVTAIQVGDVPDVQRRRRDDLLEVYQTIAIP